MSTESTASNARGTSAPKVPFGRWRVLLLSAGFGNEVLRSIARDTIEQAGFVCASYDVAEYPVDPMVHSHEACLEAIDQHDIVVAIVDEKPGGPLQWDSLSPRWLQKLEELGIRPDGELPVQTILHAEVLVSKALGKPTVVLATAGIRDRAHESLLRIKDDHSGIVLKGSEEPEWAAEEIRRLVASADWAAIAKQCNVPTGTVPFHHVAFYEHLRKTGPNWVTTFDLENVPDFREKLLGRLAALPTTFGSLSKQRIHERLKRTRLPLPRGRSLQDLLRLKLIEPGPVQALSGALPDGGSLVSSNSDERSILARLIDERDSTLLLGHGGFGKSTYALLAAKEVLESGDLLLFGAGRELPTSLSDPPGDALVRVLIGMASEREAWPKQLELPEESWTIVLDGLDEWTLHSHDPAPVLESLSARITVLATCRRNEFDRRLAGVQDRFGTILALERWEGPEVENYCRALESASQSSAANYLRGQISRASIANVFGVPLWISMISFLVETDPGLQMPASPSDYWLLSECDHAVARFEIQRSEANVDPQDLSALWASSAWLIHESRASGTSLSADSLRGKLELDDGPIWLAVRSMLEVLRDGRVVGFTHEVFLEYWLAVSIVNAMRDPKPEFADLASRLSVQRSVSTNQLVRQAVTELGVNATAASALRDAFWQFGDDQLFAKNQCLYMLGRIDTTEPSSRFLASIWASAEHNFVRYSAAYSAAMMGTPGVEEQFYKVLTEDSEMDRLNQWYHRYYYGDVGGESSSFMPRPDDATGSAKHAVIQLIDRLKRSEDRHVRLRRVELFTLRRLLESYPGERATQGLEATLDAIEDELGSAAENQSKRDMQEDLHAIRELAT